MPKYDVEREAVRRIFQHPLLAAKNAGGAFWDGHILDLQRLQRSLGAWSSGERSLARLAVNLWSYSEVTPDDAFDLNPCRWCGNLDDSVMVIVLEALATRAGLLCPDRRLAITGPSEAHAAQQGPPLVVLDSAADRARPTPTPAG